MIEYIKGALTEVTPAQAVVETGGIGYLLNISLNTYTAIQEKKDVRLYVHEVLMTGGRDDSMTLYGFATKQEREIYRMLITVSGVGSNTARMILSATSATAATLSNVETHCSGSYSTRLAMVTRYTQQAAEKRASTTSYQGTLCCASPSLSLRGGLSRKSSVSTKDRWTLR